MQSIRPSVLRLGCAALAALALATAGCETNSDVAADATATGQVLAIDPDAVTLAAATAHTVDFAAAGGSGRYEWKLATTNYGTLVAAGARAVYVSRAVVGANFVTVQDDHGNSASAAIQQH